MATIGFSFGFGFRQSPNCRGLFGIAVFAFYLAASINTAWALDIPEDEKCTAAVVGQMSGPFIPIQEKHALIIQREPWGGWGNHPEHACKYTVQIYQAGVGGQPFPSTIFTDFEGPGLVFADGQWKRPMFPYHARVSVVRLLPAPYNQLQQALVFLWPGSKDGGRSSLRLMGITKEFGMPVTFFDFKALGEITYKIVDDSIAIAAYYIPKGGCNVCGEIRSMTVRFDREAGQFGIVETDEKSGELFRYLSQKSIY